MNDKEFKGLLGEVCEDCCSAEQYCTLKELILSEHPTPRFLVQLKCIEKFKYEKSKELNKDIGWNAAHFMWVDEGYAAKFAQEFKEGMHIKDIYFKIRPKN